jgi:amino acid transporter
VITARIVYGMAGQRVLPPFLGTASRRFATPVAATVVVGVFVIAITWVYLLATSVQTAIFVARFGLRSPFFGIRRESAPD